MAGLFILIFIIILLIIFIKEDFKEIVVFVAISILIFALIFIGFALTNQYNKNNIWPPSVPSCPDYWEIDGTENNSVCRNVNDLGNCPPNSNDDHLVMNFNTPSYMGTQGNCNKYNWATKCGLTWDGITYGGKNPCQTV